MAGPMAGKIASAKGWGFSPNRNADGPLDGWPQYIGQFRCIFIMVGDRFGQFAPHRFYLALFLKLGYQV